MSPNRHVRVAKMHAAGNDFVVIDTTIAPVHEKRLAIHLCNRRVGVGADGLVTIRRASAPEDIEVTFVNPDGSVAAMCFNGARCAALRAMQLGWCSARVVLPSPCGPVIARRVSPRLISLEFGRPKVSVLPVTSTPFPCRGAYLVKLADPHLVVVFASGELPDSSFDYLARGLRHAHDICPGGTNVHFVEPRESYWRIRTFERGVEAETLACGSGCISAGLALGDHSATRFETRSGYYMTLDCRSCNWCLTGHAETVFEADISIDDF